MGYLDFTDADLKALTRERRRERLLAAVFRDPPDDVEILLAYARLHGRDHRPPTAYVRSSSYEFDPAKVRVTNTRAGRGERTARLRLWKAGHRHCFYCGQAMTLQPRAPNMITTEHRLARSRGGGNDRANIAASCATCNNRKGDMLEAEFLAILAAEKRALRGVISPLARA